MAKAIDDVLEVGVNQVDWGWRHIRLRRAGDSLKVMLIDFDQACELGREYSKIELAEFRDEVLRDLDKEVAEEHKQQRMIKEWAEKRALRRAKKLVK